MNETTNISTAQYFYLLLFEPKEFFSNYFHLRRKSPAIYIAATIFALGVGIDRVDTLLLKSDLRGNTVILDLLNNWPGYWMGAIILGSISGAILYFIGGWFYDLRIKWSEGITTIEKSRDLYLYASCVFYLVVILSGILTTIALEIPYGDDEVPGLFDAVISFSVLGALGYSLFVSFIGVTETYDVNIFKARLWFIVAPIVFYIITYASIIYLLFELV